MLKKNLPLLIVYLLIVLSFKNLTHTFFQQDEWQTFGAYAFGMSKGVSGIIQSVFPAFSIAHFNPLSAVFSWTQFFLFSTHFSPYIWLSIFFHCLNVYILYWFLLNLTKEKNVALIAAFSFGVNSISDQAVMWVAAINGYEVATTFILLSLLFFSRFILSNEHSRKNLGLALLMLFVSLLFHEIGLFLLGFYPIYLVLYIKSNKKTALKKIGIGTTIFIVVYALMRIPFFFGITNPLPSGTDSSYPPISVYPYRLTSITMKSYAQTFIPQKALITISNQVLKITYPQFIESDNTPNPYISQSILLDFVSYIISVCFLILVFFLKKKFSDNSHKKNLSTLFLFPIVFIPMSLLLYAFISGKAGYASIFEPRFIYVTSIGSSILVGLLVHSFLIQFWRSKVKKILVYFFLLLYFLIQISLVRGDIKKLENMSIPVKKFLSTIANSYPKLPKKVIFYTVSDTTYYGMADSEKILPVEVGFGEMLLVWYQAREKFPGCFYENNYLLYLLDQGYKECYGRGFGYFRNYDQLLKTVKKEHLPLSSVISFSWNSNTKEFVDITNYVRDHLQKSL